MLLLEAVHPSAAPAATVHPSAATAATAAPEAPLHTAIHLPFAGGAPEALLLLSPLLLLLSQDQLLLRGLGERQRYAPPVAAFSGYLALTAAAQVLAYVVEYGDIGVLLLHGGVVALALPQHAVFLQHVWDGSTVSGRTLIALAVLSLLALFGSQSDASRYLAGSGLVMGALQHFASAHSSRAGLKAV